MMPIKIPIAHLRLDGGTQPRSCMSQDLIVEYSDEMRAGAKIPPIDVFFDGESYWLADGFHRVRAVTVCGGDSIDAAVHLGTIGDAQWFSFSANRAHGERRTNADKQRAVLAALAHPKSSGLSDHQIAKHVGVAVQTVGNWRAKIGSPLSKLDSAPRHCTDGRTMNVSNIGRRPVHTPVAVAEPMDKQTLMVTKVVGVSSRRALPIAGTKRREMLNAKAKERVVSGLGLMDGACGGLCAIRVEQIRDGFSAEELMQFQKIASGIATRLREFAKSMKCETHEG